MAGALTDIHCQRSVSAINYFDTAFTYLDRNKERESYRRYSRFLLPRYRKQVILVSKLMERDAETAKRSLEITLKELGTDFARLIPVALPRGMGLRAMKTTGRTTLIGKNGVTPEELVRYALNLPVAAAVIGMPDVAVIESCAALARALQPMSETERTGLEQKLASATRHDSLPYLAAGYRDGECSHLG